MNSLTSPSHRNCACPRSNPRRSVRYRIRSCSDHECAGQHSHDHGTQWPGDVKAGDAARSQLGGKPFFIRLPDGPATARWLTEPERHAVLNRLQGVGSSNPPKQIEHIGPTLRDPRVWALGIFMFCMLASSYAYSFSAPAIVQSLTGLSITGTGFVIAAMFLLGAAAMYVNGIWSDQGSDTFLFVIPGCLMMSAGFLAVALSSTPVIALSGLLILIVGHMSLQGPMWAIATRFLRGRAAAAGIAAMNMIGITGGFVGPYWMGIAKDLTGNNQRGLVTMAVPMLIGACIMFYLRRQAQRDSALVIAAAAAP
jgi:MFS transporter, ACS family, tartrate transporter